MVALLHPMKAEELTKKAPIILVSQVQHTEVCAPRSQSGIGTQTQKDSTRVQHAELNADLGIALRAAKQPASGVHGLDTNNSVLDQSDFILRGGTKEEFDKCDLNGDGVLDAHELKQTMEALQVPHMQCGIV